VGLCLILRACDFFECARKAALKTKALRTSKGLVNQKSHNLSGQKAVSRHRAIGPLGIFDFRLKQFEIGNLACHSSLVTAFDDPDFLLRFQSANLPRHFVAAGLPRHMAA